MPIATLCLVVILEVSVLNIRVRALQLLRESKNKNLGISLLSSGSIDRVLVFDCETTTNEFLNLQVGYFEIYEHGNLIFQGFFFEPNHLSEKDIDVIQSYAKNQGIKLFTNSREVFFQCC